MTKAPFAQTVAGDKSAQKLYAGPKSVQNSLTNLIQNPARNPPWSEKPGPTCNCVLIWTSSAISCLQYACIVIMIFATTANVFYNVMAPIPRYIAGGKYQFYQLAINTKFFQKWKRIIQCFQLRHYRTGNCTPVRDRKDIMVVIAWLLLQQFAVD